MYQTEYAAIDDPFGHAGPPPPTVLFTPQASACNRNLTWPGPGNAPAPLNAQATTLPHGQVSPQQMTIVGPPPTNQASFDPVIAKSQAMGGRPTSQIAARSSPAPAGSMALSMAAAPGKLVGGAVNALGAVGMAAQGVVNSTAAAASTAVKGGSTPKSEHLKYIIAGVVILVILVGVGMHLSKKNAAAAYGAAPPSYGYGGYTGYSEY